MMDHVVILLRKHKRDDNSKAMTDLRNRMHVCPICGKKAFLSHDIVDGFDFGYSGGCPSFCLDDGVHGISKSEDPRGPRATGYTAREVFNTWERYCKLMEETETTCQGCKHLYYNNDGSVDCDRDPEIFHACLKGELRPFKEYSGLVRLPDKKEASDGQSPM